MLVKHQKKHWCKNEVCWCFCTFTANAGARGAGAFVLLPPAHQPGMLVVHWQIHQCGSCQGYCLYSLATRGLVLGGGVGGGVGSMVHCNSYSDD